MEVYIPIILSSLIIILFFGFLLCVITTVAPIFINHGNADDLFPLAKKAIKINISILILAVLLVLISQGTVIGNSALLEVSIGFTVWAVITHFLLKYRQKKLDNDHVNEKNK